jgi:hypothetical protein
MIARIVRNAEIARMSVVEKLPAIVPPAAREARAASYEAAFRERYPLYQYHVVEFLCEHLTDCSRIFGGDLQQMLILAVLGQVHLRDYLDMTPDGTMLPRAIPMDTVITASRLADVTGIPRETVRRKLALLAARGWIEQIADGGWRLAYRDGVSVAKTDLDALDSAAIGRFSRLLAGLERLPTG